MKNVIWPILAVAVLFAACGGDDASPASTTGTGSQSTTTGPSASTPKQSQSSPASGTAKDGVHAPLQAGNTATVKAPDAGTVTMTVTGILSPANELLAKGLEVAEGKQLWALKTKVDVKDGKEDAIADYTVETSKGSYAWTGTASANDLGYSFKQGSTKEGYVAFELPKGETVVRFRAKFSVYQGYDIVFER